ncbi:MAG TPA: D-aminoacyl-tRNA deacylase [Candidatus Acidoferrales bacterium]|nr:D-aminoacyl-tRNA deacylase [Candidatus Acidoferrales bacterium]
MRAVVQRVSRAAVDVAGERVGAIGVGLCILLSIGPEDDDEVARRFAARIATLRIFPDAAGRMNLDLAAAGGAALVVSQFTLHADTSRGHRPSFIRAAAPERAAQLYEAFAAALRVLGFTVATGRFGAHMDVDLVNEGPVTLVVSSGEPAWQADAG